MIDRNELLKQADAALSGAASTPADRADVVMQLLSPSDLEEVGGADGGYSQWGGYLMTYPSPPFPRPSGY